MYAAGHEIVARPFRRRLRQDRRLDLEVLVVGEISTSALREPVAQDEVLLQLRAAQIEIAMPQPQVLRGKLLRLSARNGDRRCASGSDDTDARASDLDVTRFHLGIAHRV